MGPAEGGTHFCLVIAIKSGAENSPAKSHEKNSSLYERLNLRY